MSRESTKNQAASIRTRLLTLAQTRGGFPAHSWQICHRDIRVHVE